MSARIAKLKDAIETMHRCKAVHVASEAVVELFRGEVAWDGVVETFDLTGHPKAKRCHAWSYEENGETQFVTVLELPPVNSAETAVEVAIASHERQMKIDRDLKTIQQLTEAVASLKAGETLEISFQDALSIKQIYTTGFVAAGISPDRARQIVESNQADNFNELGLTLKGVKIELKIGTSDVLRTSNDE